MRSHYKDGRVMRISMLFSSILLLAASAVARDKTDIITMNNGDRMTGEIKELNAGVLYVDIAYIDGTMSIQWSRVARLESQNLFIVGTEDGSVYTGTVKTTRAPEETQATDVEVTESANKRVVIARSQIVKMTQTSDNISQRVNGAIGLGVIYSKGNQSTQYELNLQTNYQQK